MKNLKYTAILFVLFAFTGCGGSGSGTTSSTTSPGSNGGGSNPPNSSASYYNLNQGSNWGYTRTYVYNANTASPTTSSENLATSIGVTAGGSTSVVTTPSSGGGMQYSMSFDSNNNLLMTDTASLNTLFLSGLVHQAKFLPANPTINTTWTVSGMTYTVTSITGSVTTAAGTFNDCLVVTATGNDGYSNASFNTTNYFSKTAGNLVKITGTLNTTDTITVDLKSYTLK